MLPTVKDLKNAYVKLQAPKHSIISEAEFADWISWTRFDPRLCEIMIKYIAENYRDMNPFLIKKNLTPDSQAVFAVLCDIANDLPYTELQNQDWKLWKKVVQGNVKKAPFQSFYIGLSTLKPSKLLLKIQKNLSYFSKWGFYSDESPVSLKYKHKNKTLIPPEQRRQILKELLEKNPQITVSDYIEALNYNIHRRQAERDLDTYDNLKKIGFTRNRIYRISTKSKTT